MLYIYTENYFFYAKIKSLVKFLLRRKNRGPQAVENSLFSGLAELGKEFQINQKNFKVCETACVLSGVKTLNWAIEQKKQGRIKKLIAGPNIVVHPDDAGKILRNNNIDIIIVPSSWVKSFYSTIAPEMKNKIAIWPAGVSLPKRSTKEKVWDFLIYNKISNNSLGSSIVEILSASGYSYKVLQYGQYSQQEYYSLLERSKYEIYLSNSESQGLAMFEAWARGVPTLVWEKGKFQNNSAEILGQISCPYLSKGAGLSFMDIREFSEKLAIFIRQSFDPRSYVESYFTNKICAQKYCDIIYGKKNN